MVKNKSSSRAKINNIHILAYKISRHIYIRNLVCFDHLYYIRGVVVVDRGVARVENREGQIIFKGAQPQEGRSKKALSVIKRALYAKKWVQNA